jgi:putative hemolysin
LNRNNTFGPLLSWNTQNHLLFQQQLCNIANVLVERILSLHKLGGIYRSLPVCSDPADFLKNALSGLNVRHSIQPEDLKAVPVDGPTVVIANHPFGGIDGMVLASILLSVRKDVKILANYFLGRIPEMGPLLFQVDPFGSRASVNQNSKSLKEAFRWVKNGGLLVVFPAGEVSHFRWQTKKIEDPEWNQTVVRIIRRAQAKVVPVYFKGRNSLAFQAAGLVHPLLRTLMLPREMLKKQLRHVRLKIGSVITQKRISVIPNDGDLVAYLRFRTYLLGNAFDKMPGFLNTPVKKIKFRKKPESIIKPKAKDDLVKDIEGLSIRQRLSESGSLSVYMAFANQIPNILQEIGRLREVTFRLVGEGTGLAVDLDFFDNHYLHLFIWNSETKEVVGAYRLAPTDEVVKSIRQCAGRADYGGFDPDGPEAAEALYGTRRMGGVYCIPQATW